MENSTNLSGFIPLEVWYEILKRLPTKSLIRFRCVSKTWNSVIRSRNFIAGDHAAAAAAGNSHLFVQIRLSNQSLVSSKHLLIDLNPLGSGLSFLRPSQSSISSSVAILAYANGVLLGTVQLGNEPRHVLCNPTIHRYVVLPEPVSPFCLYQLGLGFVPSKNDIGVVKIIHDFDVESLRQVIFPPIVKVCYARERVWKTIAPDLASTCLIFRHPSGHCCINGRAHWVVSARYQYSRYLPCDSEHLLVFDFERERFETLDLPGELVKDLKPRLSGITLLLFKQNLSVLFHSSHPLSLQKKHSLWSLMAYPDVSSWAKLWSFDAEREMLFSVFVGWRADYKLIVSRDEEDIMRVYDPDVGSSRESYVFPFNGMSADYVCGFDESLFLLDEEMRALPLTQVS